MDNSENYSELRKHSFSDSDLKQDDLWIKQGDLVVLKAYTDDENVLIEINKDDVIALAEHYKINL